MRRRWIVGVAFLAALSLRLNGQEPEQEGPRVCPLSDSQTQNAIKAFAKLAPIFSEPRCSNCHGGVSPFGQGRNHPAESGFKVLDASGNPVGPGPDEDLGKTFHPCEECHSAFTCDAGIPCWRLAPPEMRFTGKDTTALCKLMRRQFTKAVFFTEHMIDDRGGVPFLDVAFAGTMGLNQEGLDRKQDTTIIPDPPRSMTRGEMVKFSREWVSAMGGEFKGDERCGCEPVHFVVRGFYHANINMGSVLQQLTEMGPIDIPITFHDDGTYEGTGQLPLAGAGRDPACVSQSEGSLNVRISGKAVEDETQSSMHIELTNTSPATGTTAVQCPMFSGVFPLQGGNKRLLTFDMQGRAGEKAQAPFPLGPLVDAYVQVQIIDLSNPPAPAKP